MPSVGGSELYFLDTNVIAYSYDASSGRKRERAIEVIEGLREADQGCISAQVLGELYVTLLRKVHPVLDPAEASHAVREYAATWPVAPVTAPRVEEAIALAQRHRLSFWDALICAAAKACGASSVLSEDFQHGMTTEGLRLLDPFRPEFEVNGLAQQAR